MVNLRQTLDIASKLLSQHQIDYALIGGFALGVHGVHRATKDIDFLVDGSKKEKVKELLLSAGFKVFYESNELLQLQGIGYLDILFANRPHSLEMLSQSKKGLHFVGVPVVSKEAIIGLKIQAFKNDPQRSLQDKADIQALIKSDNINLAVVKKYADLFNAWPEIEELIQ